MQRAGGEMSKVRVYEVAKQINLDPKQVVTLFQTVGVTDVRNHMSSVDPEAVERVKRHLEKARTHDVVEEKVRTDGRVIKRRAIAKTTQDAPPSGQIPPTPVSQLDVAAPRSVLDQHVPAMPSSRGALPMDDVQRAPASARELQARESSARLPSAPKLPPPEERRSTRDLDVATPPPPPAPRSSRAALPSTREVVPSPP